MSYGFTTRSIHEGQNPDEKTGAVITPIYATSTFAQESPGVTTGYEYSRSGNPTREALEKCIASLENGVRGFAFASGLAASSCVLDALGGNAHVIAMNDMYGGTFRLFDKVKKVTSSLEVTYIDMTDIAGIAGNIRQNTKMIWIETPTNPLLKLVDLKKIGEFGRKHNIITVCDNTFATPYIQKPLDYGFDIVVHSATKYINGHSDVIAGIVVAREDNDFTKRIAFLQNAIGSILSPFDSFLVLRGLKTLSLRMKTHSYNAQKIAEYLESHPKVERVIYPGLNSFSQYNLAKSQMELPGGMITFFLKGGLDESRKFLENCRLFTLAESLGGVESLIEHPAIMTHASIPLENRTKLGIKDNLIRISVGIEDVEDLIADLQHALAQI